MKEEIEMGRSARWKKREVDSERSHTKSDSEVKRTSSSLHEEDEFFLFEQFALCKCIRSSSQKNDTWVNLHHHTLAK